MRTRRRLEAMFAGRRPSCAWLFGRIVLEAADGAENAKIAEHLGVALNTVIKWRKRCFELGSVATCFDRGWSTHQCAGSFAALGGASVTGGLLKAETPTELRVTVQAGSLLWSNLSQWASR